MFNPSLLFKFIPYKLYSIKNILSITLYLGLLASGIAPLDSQAYVQISPNGKDFNIEADTEALNTLIPLIAKKSHLNVVLDDSIVGEASLTLEKVSGLNALQILARMYGLSLQESSHGIWMMTSQEKGESLGLYRLNTKIIPLQDANAVWIAHLFNTAFFGSSRHVVVKANERQNSLVVSGTTDEIALVVKNIAQFDVPRLRRVYQLSFAPAVEVAQQLEVSIFGNRNTNGMMGVQTQSTIPVQNDLLSEGSGSNLINVGGTNNSSNTSSSGTSSSSSSSTASSQALSLQIRNTGVQSADYTVQTLGAIVLPNSKLNTLTIMGTASQLEQAEALIPLLDAKPPQVSIQANLIEISYTALKELGAQFNFSETGNAWAFNLGALKPGTSNSISFLPKVPTTDNLNIQIQALIQTGKAKSIASPHIVATHDSETAINITDQILRGQEFSTVSNNQFFGQTTPLIGEAGITLDILPKIGANGSITLRVRPIVTSVYASAGTGASTIELVRRRDLVAQAVQLKDGESMVIGGLIDSRDRQSEQKIPGLGDLPIVGAMFRASVTNKSRSELLILMTPHILNQLEPTPIHRVDLEALSHQH